MATSSIEVTRLLHAVRDGDEEALDALLPLVYDELHRLARMVRRGRAGETLNTTGLVHEAYLRLAAAHAADWRDRLHFFRVAALAMRQILVNDARRRKAQKRGGDQAAATFDEEVYARPMSDDVLIALDEALQRLEQMSPRQARVVELRFFAGLTVEEAAELLGASASTLDRDWRTARAWLANELKST